MAILNTALFWNGPEWDQWHVVVYMRTHVPQYDDDLIQSLSTHKAWEELIRILPVYQIGLGWDGVRDALVNKIVRDDPKMAFIRRQRAITPEIYQYLLEAGYPILPELWAVALDDAAYAPQRTLAALRLFRDINLPLPPHDLVGIAAHNNADIDVIEFLMDDLGRPPSEYAWDQIVFYLDLKWFNDGDDDFTEHECVANFEKNATILSKFVASGFVPDAPYWMATGCASVRAIHDRLGVPVPSLLPHVRDPVERAKIEREFGVTLVQTPSWLTPENQPGRKRNQRTTTH